MIHDAYSQFVTTVTIIALKLHVQYHKQAAQSTTILKPVSCSFKLDSKINLLFVVCISSLVTMLVKPCIKLGDSWRCLGRISNIL